MFKVYYLKTAENEFENSKQFKSFLLTIRYI